MPGQSALQKTTPLQTLKTTFAPRSSVVRLTPAALPKWRRAMARVTSGTADAKLLCLGDSTTSGFGVGGTATGTPGAYPYQLAAQLNARGLPAARGLGVPTSALASVTDSRWTTGTGWTNTTGFAWATGAAWFWTGPTVSNLVYTDPVLADSYDIYYLTNTATLGSFAATATGGSTTTQSAITGTAGVAKITVTAASAATTNTVTIVPQNNGTVYIIGIEPFLSTTKKMRVGNAGVSSSRTFTQWAGNGSGVVWNSQACIKAYAPDLTIIMLGVNDANDSQTAANYTSGLNTIITAAQVSGDVLLMSPVPVTSGGTTGQRGNTPTLTAAMSQLPYPFADLPYRWTSGDTANTLGLMFDALHPNALGYGDLAAMLAGSLLL